MTRTSHLALVGAVTIGAGISALGCGRAGERTTDSAQRTRPARETSTVASNRRPSDYTAIVREAKGQYKYGNQEPAIDATNPNEFDDPGDTGPNATMTIAEATPVAGGSPQYVILGRIVSDVDVPKLGVLKDTNFVWEDRTNPDSAKWEVYIIPQDSPLKPKRLKKVKGFSGGTHPGLHLVKAKKARIKGGRKLEAFAFGLCTDDCPTGHCGYQ